MNKIERSPIFFILFLCLFGLTAHTYQLAWFQFVSYLEMMFVYKLRLRLESFFSSIFRNKSKGYNQNSDIIQSSQYENRDNSKRNILWS